MAFVADNKAGYWTSICLAILVCGLHLAVCLVSPPAEVAGVWALLAAFGFCLWAMFSKKDILLRLARYVILLGIALSLGAMVAGGIGIALYSVDLAVCLIFGLVYAFLWAIYAAALQETHKRRRRISETQA
jgi:hypothetical protein